MVLDSNVLCARCKLWTFGDFNAAFIIFVDFAIEDRLADCQVKKIEISFKRFKNGITSCMAVDKVMYLLSVVLRVISF